MTCADCRGCGDENTSEAIAGAAMAKPATSALQQLGGQLALGAVLIGANTNLVRPGSEGLLTRRSRPRSGRIPARSGASARVDKGCAPGSAQRQSADAARKKRMILSVGRFFAGGHTKRHDVLIEAFRALIARSDNGIELHLAGSSSPLQPNMDYLAQLQVMAADLPVTFHLNPPPEKLWSLYKDAAVYWHATGYGAPPENGGERAEHFGISIVEAMSASCVPIAFAAGGPCEIIEEGVTGFLFDSIDVLLEKTLAMLRPGGEDRRIAVARAATDAASQYSDEVFTREVAALAEFRATTRPLS